MHHPILISGDKPDNFSVNKCAFRNKGLKTDWNKYQFLYKNDLSLKKSPIPCVKNNDAAAFSVF